MHGDPKAPVSRMHEQLLDVSYRLLGIRIYLDCGQQEANQLITVVLSLISDPKQPLSRTQQNQAGASAGRGWRDEVTRGGAISISGGTHGDRRFARRRHCSLLSSLEQKTYGSRHTGKFPALTTRV